MEIDDSAEKEMERVQSLPFNASADVMMEGRTREGRR